MPGTRKRAYDNAIADYSEAIRLNPRYTTLFHDRGDAWFDKKEPDKAIADFTQAVRLDPKDADSLSCRALAWLSKREFDRAITDLNEAIRVDPKNIWARASRGRYWLLKRDLARAAADFDTACQLDPNNTDALYQKSVYLFMTHGQGALGGMKTVLNLTGWRDDLSCYAVLIAHFAAQRDGSADKARALLDDAAVRCDTSAWPYPIIKQLRGELDEAKLMAATTDDDRMTEVRCFLGLKALQEGKHDAARTHFRWVTEHGNASYTQYAICLIEFDRLERN